MAEEPVQKTPNARTLKKSTPNTQNMKNQKSILGFFQKSSPSNAPPNASRVHTSQEPASSPTQRASRSVKSRNKRRSSIQDITPVPSSDLLGDDGDLQSEDVAVETTPKVEKESINSATPTRRAKKAVNYAESDEDEDIVLPGRNSIARGRSQKRRKTIADSDNEDEFQGGDGDDFSDIDIDDFVVPDESDEEVRPPRKRKRSSKAPSKNNSSSPAPFAEDQDLNMDIPVRTSTATKWTYDPTDIVPFEASPTKKSSQVRISPKSKAHATEPEQRYSWLASIADIDRNPPGHPDYDPRTLYIPPAAWAKFSPFEKQYWEIKHKLWDTVVFFKKGKFYELYENDATIGHQLFDLKLTDRVNMRMVGVPEMSLDYWANQFVAQGYKIARVDQSETALGKEMREKGGKGKEDKIIRRELSSVLTLGTLVEGSMLQDDMATYCVAIKEAINRGLPCFGIAFVDTATGQFFLAEFVDDSDMTKFETFVAQTRPQELLLAKSNLSTKALRILKNNTSPTTLWNTLKPGKEFWEADVTIKQLESGDYFDDERSWPSALLEARNKELAMSSFGALLQYLHMLKIDHDLVTIGNCTWYDPIKKASSLVLDGQTLINLEVFANSFDGGREGTLFQLLNHCVTPFGKRVFKQWVCHPLANIQRINERLDAVDALNADDTIREQFSNELGKLPDLERLISRVHAGACKAQDFVRVIEGFEQIDYTMSLLKQGGSGNGVIGQLINAMPDLTSSIREWGNKFDRSKAKTTGLVLPCVEGEFEDYDNSLKKVTSAENDLNNHLRMVRKELDCSSIVYRDNGKEIYQLEVPTKVKNIPKDWSQMSATKQVKRYYNKELRGLIRELQEAQETHNQIVKDLGRRMYKEFDKDYSKWLTSVKIVAELDCLISLAKASSFLGYPSCRPVFVDDERSVMEFEELRHPCMLPNVGDFIPNDVKLGGNSANINLLTGANAAGKSTILRMTCTAVIMAQIGCYVPCQSARLTPVDRIMSRLGANDNIFAAQSTFFVELAETKKILSEATPRSLVILDELGRGTSSYDGVAVAQAVLHHVATHIGPMGFFATHYHSLAAEFEGHPEIAPRRMRIHVDEQAKRVTFLYKLEEGIAEGSFGMHCASMCGIPDRVVECAEVAAKQWEHTSRLNESLEVKKGVGSIGLGWWSDVAWALRDGNDDGRETITTGGLDVLLKAIESL